MESAQNENFKRWMELHTSKGIKKHSQFLIFGKKLTDEVLKENPETVLEKISPTDSEDANQTKTKQRHFKISMDLFKKLDVFGTHSSILVCKTPQFEKWSALEKPSGLELICPIGDPSNLGALLRSALAFNVSRIVVLNETAHPLHPKSIRALSSNPFKLPISIGPSLKDLLNDSPAGLLALDGKGTSINNFLWPKNIRLLVGEEGPGFSGNLKSIKSVRIETSKNVESLNAMVAASIAMFAYRVKNPRGN